MKTDHMLAKLTRYIARKPFDLLLYLVFALAVLKLFGLYSDINVHEDNWSAFKVEHHCQLKQNSVGNAEFAWECDDGKTYYRWRQFKQ